MQIARAKKLIGIGCLVLVVERIVADSVLITIILAIVALFFLAWGFAPLETRKVLDRVPIPNFSAALDKLDKFIEAPHQEDNRLRRVKHDLGDLWTEAQSMRENAQAKQVETQVLQEPEKTERLAEWDVPDCKDWHKRTYAYIENEIGTHKALECYKRFGDLEPHDLENPNFIAKFLRVRQEDLSKILDKLREEDLS